jgi:hypothetical protein
MTGQKMVGKGDFLMNKWILAAGAAAVALGVPALAGPGNGHGGGPKGQGGGNGGGAMNVEHGHGGGGGGHGGMGGNPGHGGEPRQAFQMNGNGGGKHAEQRAVHIQRQEARGGGEWRNKHAERQFARAEKHAFKPAKIEQRQFREANRGDVRLPYVDRGFANVQRRDYRAADFCPPGLAMKGNGCSPPGQARKLLGAALPASIAAQTLSGPYSQWYRDDDRYYYRNDNDYIYRVDRNGGLINALFPSQQQNYGYYPVGMNYPSEYDSYNVPYQYQSFYPDGNDYNYRYGDGAIYQVNRSNNSIESIVALLAGDLGVGQAMPADYGVYNVPMAYRDRYYDTPDAMYRYNDGYIYQADPKTQLITAVIDALV